MKAEEPTKAQKDLMELVARFTSQNNKTEIEQCQCIGLLVELGKYLRNIREHAEIEAAFMQPTRLLVQEMERNLLDRLCYMISMDEHMQSATAYAASELYRGRPGLHDVICACDAEKEEAEEEL